MDMIIAKLVVKDGKNGYTTYQVGKDIPDVRKRVKCVNIEYSPGGFTVVGESGVVYIDVKDEIIVKRVTIDTEQLKDEEYDNKDNEKGCKA